MQKLELLSHFYCVSSTTSDPKRCHRLPKIRGNPIAEGVGAVKRIVEHVQAQLPGIRIPAMSADFIKDSSGTWWFIRVVSFHAFYRVPVPQEVMYLPESVTQVHELMRSRYFRQTLVSITNSGSASEAASGEKNLNLTIPECFLCGSLCEFSKSFTQEIVMMLKDCDDSHGGVLKELKEYRMTLKMAVDTIYLLRQRAVLMPTWESAVVTLRKSLVQTAEFTVCLLCYRIYKQQQKLHDVALELHGIFNAVSGSVADQLSGSSMNNSMHDARATKDIFDLAFLSERETPPAFATKPMRTILDQIQHFQSESCPSLSRGPADERHSVNEYTTMKGEDVDPTCTQMRLAFFFHELQDGGPDLVPTDFYLEYQLGQVFNRLHLEGSKCHTPNRWQLCETRIHYFCATFDAFADYCLEKRLLIKMKTIDGDEFHGYTVLSLRPLITAAKRFGNSLLPESRTDYLVEIRTDAYGLLTLKLTLGLLVDSVPFGHVREILLGKDFLREEPMGVYWPPPAFCYTGLAVPRDWVGALMPSEYISVVPMRSHMAGHNGRLNRAIVGTHELSQPANVSSRRLKDNVVPAAATGGLPAATRRLSVSSTRDSLLQFQRDFGKSNHQLAGSAFPASNPTTADTMRRRPILSGKPLTIAITAARRIIFRIAGEVTVFPTFLLGILLRSANFILPRKGSGVGIAPLVWSSAASFQLTRKFTVDRIFNDMKLVSVPALIALGELLLVLLKSQVIPGIVELRGLESLVEPFWLYQSDWKPVSKKSTQHSPEQRTIWNRVIRRCESAGFHSAFFRARVAQESATELQFEAIELNDDLCCGKVQSIVDKALGNPAQPSDSFRTKTQALVLCKIFEELEVQDNGYIDIAEVRSLSKVSLLYCSAPLQTAAAGLVGLSLLDSNSVMHSFTALSDAVPASESHDSVYNTQALGSTGRPREYGCSRALKPLGGTRQAAVRHVWRDLDVACAESGARRSARRVRSHWLRRDQL